MDREDKEILTTKEAACELDVKPSTIHKYVKEGKIKPVYDDSWHIDGTYLFYTKDVLMLKKELVKPGITTGEAAEMLGLHHTTISQYIQKGLLRAEKKPYRGRDIYFIEPEEIERFKSNYESKKKRKRKEFYNKETGFAWFQSFIDPQGNKNNRILLGEDGEPFLRTYDNRQIPVEFIKLEGFQPINPIPDIDYIHKRGYAKFRFTENDTFYQIIELFYQNLGPKNMKLTIAEDLSIIVEVKPILIKDNYNVFEELEKSLVEGSVTQRLDGIYIDSDLEIITIAAPSQLKKLIKEDADKLNINMEDLVLKILKEKYGFFED
ncbi:hypothetical protein C0966_17545 (plasmid) [Bacillus methanolicus]|uniref:helix-turn-helix domain-containing protein n=1 Tax=Bacillus methanolicus TaxID=1471 RepID=UPI0023800901|nr:helix-turn-helix domain-containing protein [Bacillus methanolicus]MDE3841068.1 hypothetical protein [Bacillus methanolicus]